MQGELEWPRLLERRGDRVLAVSDRQNRRPTRSHRRDPSYWPPGPDFDVGELFTDEFAARYGYEDPDAPGSFLTLCELFERGIVAKTSPRSTARRAR
jgi:hypothetical protein